FLLDSGNRTQNHPLASRDSPVDDVAMRNLNLNACLTLSLFLALVLGVADRNSQIAADPVETDIAIPATDDGLPGAGPIRRADWFQKLWVQRRSQWAKEVEQDQNAVVFLGDSITQGWGDRLAASFPGMKLAN